jgi:hypothetical protein
MDSTNPLTGINKRTHNLANGGVIWDLSGNLWEVTSDTCIQGSGVGYWYNSSTNFLEWNDSNLQDYERMEAGPDPIYTSAQNAGKYRGCYEDGRVIVRGGAWNRGINSGIFTTTLEYAVDGGSSNGGFRCTKSAE